MFYDTKTGEIPDFDAERYDVCIAGAGPAGITLALSLAAHGRRVLILEGGGFDYDPDSQDLYRGDIVGKEYYPLDAARLRHFGGSTGHWGGWSRPLEDYDFEVREHIPGSGWPIRRADLAPYQDRVCTMLDIASFDATEQVDSADGVFQHAQFHYSMVRFGEKYRAPLAEAQNIDVVLNANVVDVRFADGGERVESFLFKGYGADDPGREARAGHFVVAMGGLENARFLLNASGQGPQGVGNQSGLVGLHFQEHPHYTVGAYIVEPKKTILGRERVVYGFTNDFINAQKVVGVGLRWEPITLMSDVTLRERLRYVVCTNDLAGKAYALIDDDVYCAHSFSRDVKDLPTGRNIGKIRMASEQMPNAASRVYLTDARDRFGLRRLALDWRVTDADVRAQKLAGLEAGRYLARTNQGRIKLANWIMGEDPSFPDLAEGQEVGGFHHMCTTRMGASAADGVVDANCRVFSTQNLYLAGSSVFRTGGFANPTVTIMQLALRLGDHLAAIA